MEENIMEKINYVALLRGVNVGGNNIIKMNELKIIFEIMNLSDVKTYIQSGNVIKIRDGLIPQGLPRLKASI
jgi:uncharacterized protein (DUF1697 family)